MLLEMLGFRMLAPFFGYTIYIWANLIGIVMLASSLGFFVGILIGVDVTVAVQSGIGVSTLVGVKIEKSVGDLVTSAYGEGWSIAYSSKDFLLIVFTK